MTRHRLDQLLFRGTGIEIERCIPCLQSKRLAVDTVPERRNWSTVANVCTRSGAPALSARSD